MLKVIFLIYSMGMACISFAQEKNVFGKVLSSEDGKPLTGAAITLKESHQYAISDTAGNFFIKLQDNNLTLHVTHIGFIPQTLLLSGKQNSIVIYLNPVKTVLKDIIVSTGYQNISKERATGSFTTISNSLLNRRVGTDILSRLEDVSSGLLFDKRFNGRPSLSIRGQSTILSNAAPLIVVDNFPYEGDVNSINPNDIERVTILKDAAAASIWGARAGNGVIVITTKRGRLEQPLKIDFNSNLTIGDKPDLYYNRSFINSSNFIDVEKLLFTQRYYSWQETDPGQTLSPVVKLLIAQRDGQITTADAESRINALRQNDVRKDISDYFYQKSSNRQYSISLRGGQSRVNYFLSGGFDKNRDNLIRNGLDRITLNSQTTYYPVKSLEISTNIVYSQNTQKENNTGAGQINSGGGKGLYPYAQIADNKGNPLAIVRDYNSSFIDQAVTSGLLDWAYKPLQDLQNADYTLNLEDTRINTSAKYYFNQYLNVEGRYQFEHQTTTVNNFQKQETYYVRNLVNQYAYTDPSRVLQFPIPAGGILDNSISSLVSHAARGQINFNKAWNDKNDIVALGGVEIRRARVIGNGSRLYGYDDNLLTSIPVDYITGFSHNPYGYSARIPYYVSLTELVDRNISYFANAAYTYNKRYIISVSARKDESNLFGVNANQKGVPLWSVGLGWIASSEKAYPFSSWLPYLKIRTTYGYNGNINKTLTAYTTASYSTNYTTGLQQAQILTPPNRNLRWEKISLFNTGIDFETKNNLLSGSIEYYHKKGIDLIGNSPLDPTAGFNVARRTNFTGNNADMTGHGFDVQLTINKGLGKINWISQLLFSYSTDRVTKYEYENRVSNYFSAIAPPKEGKPRYGIYSYKWAGLDPQTGDPQVDLNGKVSKDYAAISSTSKIDGLIYNGPALPPYFGSFRNTFSRFGFSIGFNISYKFGYYFRRTSINYTALFDNWIGNVDYEKRWQKPGDEKMTQIPSMPVAGTTYLRDYTYTNSSVIVEKGDHIRFQDINLSYQFDKSKYRWLPFSNLSVYGYVNNLGFIWRANKLHIDPDYIYLLYPPSKTYSLGLKIQF